MGQVFLFARYEKYTHQNYEGMLDVAHIDRGDNDSSRPLSVRASKYGRSFKKEVGSLGRRGSWENGECTNRGEF